MKETFKIAGIILSAIALSILFFWGMVKAGDWELDQIEIQECKHWTLEANKLKDYYFTQWQADQCAAHNIKINAPVK